MIDKPPPFRTSPPDYSDLYGPRWLDAIAGGNHPSIAEAAALIREAEEHHDPETCETCIRRDRNPPADWVPCPDCLMRGCAECGGMGFWQPPQLDEPAPVDSGPDAIGEPFEIKGEYQNEPTVVGGMVFPSALDGLRDEPTEWATNRKKLQDQRAKSAEKRRGWREDPDDRPRPRVISDEEHAAYLADMKRASIIREQNMATPPKISAVMPATCSLCGAVSKDAQYQAHKFDGWTRFSDGRWGCPDCRPGASG
jgi:hypothetical protein